MPKAHTLEKLEEELSDAVEAALLSCGSAIRPSWVMKFIMPIIEKYFVGQIDIERENVRTLRGDNTDDHNS